MTLKLLSLLADCVTEKAVDETADIISGKKEKKTLESIIKDYIMSQQKYNHICTLAEEIDFQGLADYLECNYLSDVNMWLCSVKSSERGCARDRMISAALHYSGAKTPEARKRVVKIVSDSLDIIRAVNKKRINNHEAVIASEIVDAVIEETKHISDDNTEIVKQRIDSLSRKVDELSALKENHESALSIDKAVYLAKSNNWSGISDSISDFVDHVSKEHPLAPDYGFEYEKGLLKSVPLSTEAVRKYPPRMELTCDLYLDGKKQDGEIEDIFDYQHRHQLPLLLDVKDAVQYLGDNKDPVQFEAKKSIGSKLVLNPPKLSETRLCSIMVNSITYYDLVYIKVQEILDDGTYVIGNRDTDSDIYFELRINEADPLHPKFSVKVKHSNNKSFLKVASFYRDLNHYKDLHIYDLSSGKDIIGGKVDFSMESDFGSMDEEAEFLRRLCDIEDYFDIILPSPKEVSRKDISLIKYISNLIREEAVTCPWDRIDFRFTLDPKIRSYIQRTNGQVEYVYYIKDSSCEILGTKLEFRYIRYIEKASIDNFDKVLKKLEVLDDGDEIKFTIISAGPASIYDSLKIPQELEL